MIPRGLKTHQTKNASCQNHKKYVELTAAGFVYDVPNTLKERERSVKLFTAVYGAESEHWWHGIIACPDTNRTRERERRDFWYNSYVVAVEPWVAVFMPSRNGPALRELLKYLIANPDMREAASSLRMLGSSTADIAYDHFKLLVRPGKPLPAAQQSVLRG